MALTLHIKDDNRLLGEADARRRLESGTLTIGRGAENDWVLPDPERVISKQHCAIAAVEGGYVLTDTSSNGVFINAGPEPVGRGNSVPLRDGDQIRISHFEFEASVEPAAATARVEPEPPRPAPAPGPDPEALAQGDPFLDDLLGPGRSGHPAEGGSLDEMLGPAGAVEDKRSRTIPDDSFDFDPAGDRPATGAGTGAGADHIPADRDTFAIPEAIPEDWLEEGGTTGAPPLEEPPSAPAEEAAAPAIPARPAPPPPPPARPAAGYEDAFLQAFLRAAGLENLRIDDEAKAETAEVLGRIYREVVRGLMEILAARSSIKNEFRLTQTVIQPVQNNPLKFSLNVDEAMTTLLTKSGSGYLPPVAAVQEAINDLKAHQVAMLAGMQQALNGLLARFDPAALERRIGQDKSAGSLLAGKKARYWDAFIKLYEQIAAEAEDDFHSAFGREFGRAYEEQIRKQRK